MENVAPVILGRQFKPATEMPTGMRAAWCGMENHHYWWASEDGKLVAFFVPATAETPSQLHEHVWAECGESARFVWNLVVEELS